MTVRLTETDCFAPPVSTANWGGRCTRAEVNLDAIGHNVRWLRAHAAGAELMAVVKANGYGHGATRVARTALESGATWIGVYTAEEGIALRREVIEAPILVFGQLERVEAEGVVAHGLTATVWSLTVAAYLEAAAQGGRIPIHVKVDTGLTRAGVPIEDLQAFLAGLRRFPSLEVEGLFTHFACADQSDGAPTKAQLRSYHAALAVVERTGITVRWRHAANSAAALNTPAAHLDMVRCGIALYGYDPRQGEPMRAQLEPALSWLSSVTRLYLARIGTGVGYGHEFRCSRTSVIGLVPVGYGDGLSRSLGLGHGKVLVRGQSVPIVGRVSMDQITIDVTDVPGVAVGDEIVIIGRQGSEGQPATVVAADAGTICYEVVCGIMPRVPRLYVRHGRLID